MGCHSSGVVGVANTSSAYYATMAAHTSGENMQMVLWATLKEYIRDL